ncbi:MAG: hypothetical protein H7315_14360 [Herminiimonas sp.]|nr:hypothetical protein [Herminiimonas sp.]
MTREFGDKWWISPSHESDLFLQGIAEGVIKSELEWMEHDIHQGYDCYYPSITRWGQLPQPWASSMGIKKLASDWLFTYARAHDDSIYKNFQFFPTLADVELRAHYRNIFDPISMSNIPNSPWLYFDPIVDNLAKEARGPNKGKSSSDEKTSFGQEYLNIEKPWRTSTIPGFPPASNAFGDDEYPQYCKEEMMFAQPDFYFSLFNLMAPNWQYVSKLSSKYLLTFIRPFNDKFQWAILLERSKNRFPMVRQFDLVLIPTSVNQTVKPKNILFQYHFPFSQNRCVAIQQLALWQADMDFKYRHFEKRMQYLEPLIAKFLK